MEEIIIGELKVDVSDLTDMNKTELIRLCRMRGVATHRGLSKKSLALALQGKKVKSNSSVEEHRAKITAFLKQHWDTIKSQVGIRCHGHCEDHTDFQVEACWKLNKEIIERHS